MQLDRLEDLGYKVDTVGCDFCQRSLYVDREFKFIVNQIDMYTLCHKCCEEVRAAVLDVNDRKYELSEKELDRS